MRCFEQNAPTQLKSHFCSKTQKEHTTILKKAAVFQIPLLRKIMVDIGILDICIRFCFRLSDSNRIGFSDFQKWSRILPFASPLFMVRPFFYLDVGVYCSIAIVFTCACLPVCNKENTKLGVVGAAVTSAAEAACRLAPGRAWGPAGAWRNKRGDAMRTLALERVSYFPIFSPVFYWSKELQRERGPRRQRRVWWKSEVCWYHLKAHQGDETPWENIDS